MSEAQDRQDRDVLAPVAFCPDYVAAAALKVAQVRSSPTLPATPRSGSAAAGSHFCIVS